MKRMNKIFNLTSNFKASAQQDGSVKIRGMASTADFDRAGDSIKADAWDKGGLNNFKKNPIILFNHDYDRPIGRATGVQVTDKGLELEAKISKSAHAGVCDLVKDGVLGAFSVGFRVKDADYIEETDGLMIKDAELFEVSVVSVPCNQAATFSLAKSFDSIEEYDDFKKTFTNRVDLAGQSLAKEDVRTSSIASNTPVKTEKSVQEEIVMSEDKTPEIDLEAFAKQVAEQTATRIAMKQSEQKAVEKAEAEKVEAAAAEKTKQEESVKTAIKVGVETGAERLVADVEAKLAAKDAQIEEVLKQHKTDLEEKKEEISRMQDSKRVFANRGDGDISKWGKEFLYASVLGKVTGKGWDTDYARDIMQKAGVTYDASTGIGLDASVSSTFENEVRLEQKVANLFREMAVTSGATVMPIIPDTEDANWNATGLETTANLLEEKGASDNNFHVGRVTLNAYRLISGTFIANDTDEQIVVNVLPWILSALARAHARAIDSSIMNGTANQAGLCGGAGTDGAGSFLASDSTGVTDIANDGSGAITGANLLAARSEMGKYGVNPNDVAYVVNVEEYFNLIADAAFSDISEVGSEVAMKVVGQVGSIYGSPVVASDQFARATTKTAACAVNVHNYLMPRLKSVGIETDYEVAGQRTAVVAAQSRGFEELVAGSGADQPAVRIEYA
ncbi:MAG TPA: HK97 family phage prohead protease [Flavobacteriales bacterium]|nr:HK97 family phage prohead protease [Flavobacteriales bacterium]